MTLATPPAYNQMSAKEAPSDDCGETCVASVATVITGSVVTVDEVVALKSGETTAADVINLLRNFGINANTATTPLADHYNIVAIWSDPGGNPQAGSGIGHWLLQYGPDQYMNPYGGRLVTYTSLPVQPGASYIQISNLPKPPLTEGPYSMHLKQALIFNFRLAAFRSWPENQEAVDFYANLLADDLSNYEEVITRAESDWIKNGGVPLGGRN